MKLHLPHQLYPFLVLASILQQRNFVFGNQGSVTMNNDKTTDYVTLVSNDGYEFKLLRSAACIAGTIKRAMNPECKKICLCIREMYILIRYAAGFQETARNRMEFPTIKYVTFVPFTARYFRYSRIDVKKSFEPHLEGGIRYTTGTTGVCLPVC